jgi:hypothetical protein
VRRFGKLFTVARVAAASEYGAYDVDFAEGATVRLASVVSVVDDYLTTSSLIKS